MADKAKEIIGVEVNPDAIKDAKVNTKLNGIKNAKHFVGYCWGPRKSLDFWGERSEASD